MPISTRARRIATTVVALAAATPVLASASPATAGELRFRDSRHDVMAIDVLDDNSTPVADPTTTNGDITSAFIHYRAGRLVARLNYVDLKRSPNTLLDYSGEIRTNEGVRRIFDVMTEPGKYAGHDLLLTPGGREACKIGHMFDYQENFTRVVVPLGCLSNPRWVRMRLGAATFTFDPKAVESGDVKPGDLVAHLDDAQSDTVDFTR